MATILHAIIGYFILLLAVRVLNRRPGAQMSLFEFVLIFLLGGTIILSTVGNDRSLTNCTCAAMVVGLLHRVLSWGKSKNPRLGAILDGTPLVVIRHGQLQEEVVRGMKLRREDLEAAARVAGLPDLSSVDYAILERNGRISAIAKDEE